MRQNSEQITSTAFCPDFCMHVRKEVPVLYFLIKQRAYNLTRPFWEASKSLSHLQLAGQQCRLSIWFNSVLWGRRSVNVSLRGDPWEVRNKKGQRPFDLASQSQCILNKPSEPLSPSGSPDSVLCKSPVRDSTASQGSFWEQKSEAKSSLEMYQIISYSSPGFSLYADQK